MSISLSPDEKSIWRIVQAIIQVLQGRSNAVGSVTLTPGTTTTVITKAEAPAAINCSKDSAVMLSPLTANAAAALATTFTAAGQGTFTVTHANAVSADRSFRFEVRG